MSKVFGALCQKQELKTKYIFNIRDHNNTADKGEGFRFQVLRFSYQIIPIASFIRKESSLRMRE